MPHKMLFHINVSRSMCHNESHCVAISVTQNLVTLIRPSKTNDREFSPYSASTSLSFRNKIVMTSFCRVIRPPRGNTLHKHSSADTQAQPSLFLAAVKLAAVTAATTTAREQRSLSTRGVGCMDTREGPSSLPALAQNARLRLQGTWFTSLQTVQQLAIPSSVPGSFDLWGPIPYHIIRNNIPFLPCYRVGCSLYGKALTHFEMVNEECSQRHSAGGTHLVN